MKLKLLGLGILATLLLTGCTDKDKAERILKAEGYTDIYMDGYKFLACSKDDFYHTGFIAKKNGNDIKGTVCSGLIFRGSTIRLD